MAFRTNKVPAIEERTVSGSSVSFNSAFALPLKACKVSFSATQAGSGEPSPSNPRAISGVSAIGLTANSTPVSVSLGDTRYGGELDVLTGELTINYTEIVFNGTEIWNTYGGTVGYYCLLRDMKLGRYGNGLSNRFKIISSNTQLGIMLGYDNRIAYFCQINQNISEVTDLATWKTWLSNNNVELVYPLDEPITIQLSANELSSIIGNNTFSTDAGTLEITFADLQEKSASGSVATFNTALAMPLPSCNIAVDAWQEGSGDPSPSNVRPIHGFSEVNAYQRAVNLWDEITKKGYYNNNGIYVNSTNELCSVNMIPVKPNTSIYVKAPNTVAICFYDKNGAFIRRNLNQSGVVNVVNNAYYININLQQSYGTSYHNDVSINYPSTDTDYHAYTGNIYTIQLGQEVYGAEVDAVNGVARVEWIKKVIDETSGVIRADNGILYLDDFFDVSVDSMSVRCNCYTRGINRSNVSQVMDLNNNYSFCCKSGGATDKRVMIKDTRFNTIEEFNEWVALNPISVLIMLAEPIEIQLTPTQIETLIGNNTIFADTGDIDLTFKDLDIAKRGSFREVFKLPS